MEYRTIRPAQFSAESRAEPGGSASELVLDEVEIRLLGSLVEKETTTPEYYPLTLNALTSACNQKSSRNPVVSHTSDEVGAALGTLREKGLATEITSREAGRVARYRHLFLERFQLNRREAAVLCVLMLRGPQTVGEIRGRSERLFEFSSLAEVEESLALLAAEESGPLVVKLPRVPGTKESRYAHQLGGTIAAGEAPPPAPTTPAATPLPLSRQPNLADERVTVLQQEVNDLKERLSAIERQFEDFRRVLE
jgi:hypothetical protein